MQMIAEVYGIMRDGLGMEPDRGRRDVRALERRRRCGPTWSRSPPRSARATDPETGRPLVEVILDRAGQKGTGRWTRDRGAASRCAGDGDRGGGGRAQRLGPARRAPRRGGAVRAAAQAVDRPRRTDRSRRRCSPARSPATPRASASSPPPPKEFGWDLPLAGDRPGLARRLHHPLGAARRDGAGPRRDAASNLMFAPAFAEGWRATHGSLRRRRRHGGARRHADAGARRRARLFRDDAQPSEHRQPVAGAARFLRPARLRARRPPGRGTTAPGAATPPARTVAGLIEALWTHEANRTPSRACDGGQVIGTIELMC